MDSTVSIVRLSSFCPGGTAAVCTYLQIPRSLFFGKSTIVQVKNFRSECVGKRFSRLLAAILKAEGLDVGTGISAIS